MNRRDLLTYAGAAGALSILPAGARRHAAAGPRAAGTPLRLIMVLAQGGWDTTYALDPKLDTDLVDPPEMGGVVRYGELDVFVHPAAAAVGDYFAAHAGSTAIVRGISVSSVVHRECVKRMATGTRSETNADMGAIVGNDLGQALPLPYLILGDTAFAGPYAVSAGRVGATNQIITLLDPAQAYRTRPGPLYTPTAGEDPLLAAYAAVSANRLRATRGALGYNRKRVDDFVEAIDRGKRLEAVRAGFGARGRALALDSQVALALDALETGISQAVMLNTRLAWDTHDRNTDQAGFHHETFGGLKLLLDGLATRPGTTAGSKMIDDTLVVCFSEFSRTPKRNAAQGKDHWPVTSALVAGAGIRGGRVFGASTDAIEAAPVDYATGAVAAGGLPLTSQSFVAGVLAAAGVDPAAHLGNTEVFRAFVA